MPTKAAILDPIDEAVDLFGYSQFYLGAFGALRIGNLDMAGELARMTRSSDEAVRAVAIMREAEPGDRVWPALNWLIDQRAIEVATDMAVVELAKNGEPS